MATQHDDHLTTEQVAAFIDKQLSPQEQTTWNAHLQTCKDCQSRAAAMRQTVALLHSLPQPQVPRSFALPTNVTYLQERPQQEESATTNGRRNRPPGNYYVRRSLRALSTIVAVIGFVFILSSFSFAAFHGSSASNTSTTSSGQAPFSGTAKTPREVMPRGSSPGNCEQYGSPAATCNASRGTAQPSPPVVATPTTSQPANGNNEASEPPGVSGIDLNTPQGHLELGSALLLLGVFGFVLTRRKRVS